MYNYTINSAKERIMSEDLQTMINTTEHYERVFIDKYDDNELWLSIQVRSGSARATLTFEQARQMVEAINRVLATEVSA
jgi:hypothetical protein